MTRAIITSKTNINKFYDLETPNTYVYWAYVEYKGYVLIIESNNNTWFNPIKSKTNPTNLYHKYGEPSEAETIEEIHKILRKSTKKYYNEHNQSMLLKSKNMNQNYILTYMTHYLKN